MESESVEGESEASERSEACRLLLLDVVSIGSARKRLPGAAGDAIGRAASGLRNGTDSVSRT